MTTNLLRFDIEQLLRALDHTTGLSTMSGGAVSHDKITRLLSEKDLDSPELLRLVKPLVRKLKEGVTITDDTVEEEPYTDESELVRWHYDLSQDETVKGINLLNALYQAGEISLHEAFELLKLASSNDRIAPQQLSLPVYGNYCGPGHGDPTEQTPPIDAVDAVCREHNRCYRLLGGFDYRCDRALVRDMPSAIADTSSPIGKSAGFLALLHFSSTLLPSRRPRR